MSNTKITKVIFRMNALPNNLRFLYFGVTGFFFKSVTGLLLMFAQQSIVRQIVLLQQLCKSDLIMHWHPAIRGKPMKQQKHTYLHSFQPLGNGALHVLEWHHVHLRSFGSRLVKLNTLCLKHSMEIVYGCSSSLMQHPVATTCMQNFSIKLFQANSSVNQGFQN